MDGCFGFARHTCFFFPAAFYILSSEDVTEATEVYVQSLRSGGSWLVGPAEDGFSWGLNGRFT